MKDMEWLIEQIDEEFDDAENYAWKAMHYKSKDHELSSTCAELSRQELTHAEMLCTQGERMSRKYKDAEEPEHKAMHTVWEWSHKKFLERKHKIRALLTSV